MITIFNIVSDTYTNAEGYKLFLALDIYFQKNEKVEVSFDNLAPISSSFFNSSFGELIDKYSYEKFKETVHPVNIKKGQAELISLYISQHIKLRKA